MTMEELCKQEMEKNRKYDEFNKKIVKEIWGNR